jgi:hypothetical protein
MTFPNPVTNPNQKVIDHIDRLADIYRHCLMQAIGAINASEPVSMSDAISVANLFFQSAITKIK